MSPRKAVASAVIAWLGIAAQATAAPSLGNPQPFFDGCDAVLDTCSLGASMWGASDAPFALEPIPAPLRKAGQLPEFFLRIDGFYYTIDLSQPAALFITLGTVAARVTSAQNCRRSDGVPQVISAGWYAFIGAGFEIVYEVEQVEYRLGRTPSGRYVMDLRTKHGKLICDGQVDPGPSPDDLIFRDGMEVTPSA